jgi:hypothetical protein
MSIPTWTPAGLVPPIRPGAGGADADRSPYVTTMLDLLMHMGTTDARRSILRGLLKFRQALYDLGLISGWQWIDGSFMEEVEVIENRPPNDVDVVTFIDPPKDLDLAQLYRDNPTFFGNEKRNFHVDAYYFELGRPTGRFEVSQIAYWYSLWSHRRTGEWKGFLQIDLDKASDNKAQANLDAMIAEGGAA